MMDSYYYQACGHPRTAGTVICPLCLQQTCERAARAIQQTAAAQRALAAGRQQRRQECFRPGGHRSAPGGADGRGRAEMEYILPPLQEVLRMTRGEQRGPAPRRGSHLYLWGYDPLRNPVFEDQAEPTAEARAFAAAHGWEAGRPGAWALELVLPLPLSEALREMGPLLRGTGAIRGWGGCTGRAAPDALAAPADPASAAADQRRSAHALCARARAAVTSVAAARARQQQLRDQVRNERLARLKQLPPEEFDALNRAVTAALDLGKAGQLAAGYALLLARWEQAAMAAQQGIPWSSSLYWIYGIALENYLWRYGPALP